MRDSGIETATASIVYRFAENRCEAQAERGDPISDGMATFTAGLAAILRGVVHGWGYCIIEVTLSLALSLFLY
jgi:hypothetical protein